ncbi:MAG: hypothetical protein JXM70_27645 [Pirellulales bacterium]|nr:hypothetical protein [Pirellulales bacterium]
MDFIRVSRAVTVTVVILIPTLLACGDGRPKRVPVSGIVTIDGKPLTCGFITLKPKDARPSTGNIGKDGRFTLTCFEKGDGAVEGTHAVAVNAFEQLNSNTLRWHAPKKYSNPNTSGKTVTIDGPTDSLTIELSWEGGRPFDENIGGGE